MKKYLVKIIVKLWERKDKTSKEEKDKKRNNKMKNTKTSNNTKFQK